MKPRTSVEKRHREMYSEVVSMVDVTVPVTNDGTIDMRTLNAVVRRLEPDKAVPTGKVYSRDTRTRSELRLLVADLCGLDEYKPTRSYNTNEKLKIIEAMEEATDS